MRICELKQKEVINICNCKSMGYPTDVDFNCEKGILKALIVPGSCKFCSLWSTNEYIIPWHCIKQIGDDIILVEISEEKCLQNHG